MSTDEFEVEEGREVVRQTIVGGRPLARRARSIRVPIGVEKVLVRAAADPVFRHRLFTDRAAVLAQLGGDLSQTEAAVLAGVPAGTLTEMVNRIDLKGHGNGRFMKGVVAAALVTSAASALLGCDALDGQSKGCRPDVPDTTEARVQDWSPNAGVDIQVEDLGQRGRDGAASPDAQDATPASDVIEVDQLPAPGGILPDAF
jgi:hypothetical protein